MATEAESPQASKDYPVLRRVCDQIKEISTLPEVALRAMEVANDPDSGAVDLKEVMESDAALSSRVLRCVNSAAYGLVHKVSNLQRAIAYLGMKEIRNLALTASVSRLFKRNEEVGPYTRQELWRHFVSVGLCSRLLAMRLGSDDFEDIFLGGLLHDIGIVLEDQHAHPHFVQVMESLENASSLMSAEEPILRFDHTRLGEAVARDWRFPAPIIDAIRFHHTVDDYQGPYGQMVHCVAIANFVCSVKGITSIGVNLVKFPQRSISQLSLAKADLIVLADDLDKEIVDRSDLFEL